MRDETYQVLAKPRTIESEMKTVQAEIDGLRSSMMPKGISYDGVKGHSSEADPMAGYAARLEPLEKKKEALQGEYLTAYDEAVAFIHKIPEGLGREIVTKRWIGNLKFSEIIDTIPASERSMYREYKRAVSILDRSWQ